MRKLLALALASGALSMGSGVEAAVLYGATSAGGPGELYVLNPANGAMVQDVGPLNDVTGRNYPITGLAVNPVTGVLYGSTGNSQAATAAMLVSINPATGAVVPIGSFNAGPVNTGGTPATMADLAFDAAGNLYGVGSIGGPQLYSINSVTGQATVVGSTGLTSTSGGGVAITSAGTIYGTPTSSRFGTYNAGTGAYTNITAPSLPVGGAYAALAYDGTDVYGLDLGPGSAGLPAELVKIDAAGNVTDLGASVPALDAIAFAVPEPGMAGVFGAAMVFTAARKRRA